MTDNSGTMLKIGDMVDLTIERLGGEETSLRTTVYNVMSATKFSVGAPFLQGKLYPLEIGKHLQVYYHVQNSGVFSFSALVVSRVPEDSLPAIQLLRTTDIKKSQRRMFYRVPYFGTAEMHVDEDTELSDVERRKRELLKQKYANNPNIVVDEPTYRVIKLECRDLSGGGFRFITTQHLQIGQEIKGILELEGQKLEYNAKITRVQKNELPYEHYDVGCMFLEMPEIPRARIINYVFKKERSNLNQKK